MHIIWLWRPFSVAFIDLAFVYIDIIYWNRSANIVCQINPSAKADQRAFNTYHLFSKSIEQRENRVKIPLNEMNRCFIQLLFQSLIEQTIVLLPFLPRQPRMRKHFQNWIIKSNFESFFSAIFSHSNWLKSMKKKIFFYIQRKATFWFFLWRMEYKIQCYSAIDFFNGMKFILVIL